MHRLLAPCSQGARRTNGNRKSSASSGLDRLPRAEPGCPGPLEVEAAEVAGDIDDFTDEVKARHSAAFHAFGGEFVCVHAAGGDFGFGVTFIALRSDRPVVCLALEFREGMVCP